MLTTSLDNVLSQGQIVNRTWLNEKGFNNALIDYYLRSGTLKAVVRGAYCRPGPPLKWEHIVYSLQVLQIDYHIGGRSALELQGLAHYLPLQGMKQIHLFSQQSLPRWINHINTNQLATTVKFVTHRLSWLHPLPVDAVTAIPFGHWDWTLNYAQTELALLELVADIQSEADFDLADKFFESATALRPKLVRELLLATKYIRIKRLFLWFAKRHDYQWHKSLDKSGINLGSGKRMIIKNGRFDKEYQITVPEYMIDEPEQSIF